LQQYREFIYSLAYRHFGLKLIRNAQITRKAESSDPAFAANLMIIERKF
jgi:hypothetical protein